MYRSVLRVPLAAAMVLLAAGCSLLFGRRAAPPPAAVSGQTATLAITRGITTAGRVRMPAGFAPAPGVAPLWLAHGEEIAVIGERDKRVTILGFGGAGFKASRLIASDSGLPGGEGMIVDVAASPDGSALAMAVVRSAAGLRVYVRELRAGGAQNRLADFDGSFESVSLSWLGERALVLALRAAHPPAQAAGLTAPGSAERSDGLFVIGQGRAPSTTRIAINCRLSTLKLGPTVLYAVAEGDPVAAPVLVDLRAATCKEFKSAGPIRVLNWAPDGRAFLYAGSPAPGSPPGVFRYDVPSGAQHLVAIGSAAAAYTSTGQVLALGNRQLTWQRLTTQPGALIEEELALERIEQGEVRVTQLGIKTTAMLLAQSTMVFSTATDQAAIDTFSPAMNAPIRQLITYSVATGRAFLIASGRARGAAAMSWSPKGDKLALVDGDAGGAVLTVFAPAR